MSSRLLAVLTLALVLLGVNVAQAHEPILYYPFFWGADRSVPFYIADHDFDLGHAPGPTAANRIFNGITVWNGQNQSLKFSNGGQNYALSWDASCGPSSPLQADGLYWMVMDGPSSSGGTMVAETRACVKSSSEYGAEMVWTHIRFDSQETWYTGTSETPLGMIDLYGVATHEAGHAAGHWIHWDDPGGDATVCLPPWPKHTMCSTTTIPGSDARSLELHDFHTFSVAY